MSYNGSGTFLINTAGQPVVSGTVISSTAFNALTADLATGLSTAITKDGQTTVTANIPMGTYKFTGLGAGTAATDSANLSQVQSTVTKLLASVSGADTITAVGSPTLGAYASGQMFYFVAASANTGAVTINIDSLGAKSITRDGTTALAAGDIQSGEVCVIVYDGTQFQLVNGASQSASIVTENLTVNKATVLNESGGDNDTRIEGDTDANLFFADASTDRIGIGTNAPDAPLHIAKSSATSGVVINAQNSTTGSLIQLACPGVANVRFGAPNADAFVWQTFGSGSYPERMRLDSPGNLGLGVTPSAWDSTFKNIQIGGSGYSGSFYSQANGDISNGIVLNAYYNAGWKYTASSKAATQYEQNNGIHKWSVAPSGTAGNTITFTQAMTLTVNGDLGLGTTTPSNSVGYSTLSLSGSTGGQLVFQTAGTYKQTIYSSATDLNILNGQAGNLTFGTNNTERARIVSGGAMGVNTTTPNLYGQLTVRWDATAESTNGLIGLGIIPTAGTADAYYTAFWNQDGTLIGSIRRVGTTGAVVYNTTSDRRLKENIASADDAGPVIDAIEIVKHDWKNGGSIRYGVIAQDLYEVAPEAVSVGDHNDIEEPKYPWGVDYSKLVPMLVKEVQSLRKRVAELESK
jgi:hypothetical protein